MSDLSVYSNFAQKLSKFSLTILLCVLLHIDVKFDMNLTFTKLKIYSEAGIYVEIVEEKWWGTFIV